LEQSELSNALFEVKKYIDDKGLKTLGFLINTTHSIAKHENKDVLDFEILVPMNAVFETENDFVYKPNFRIVNAVQTSHVGDPKQLSATYLKLLDYLNLHKLSQITPIYNRQISYSGDKVNPEVIEVFVGVNPNII